jgi:hypothetical protein
LVNKKGDSRAIPDYPLEIGTKKAKAPPHQSEALLPVIFYTIIVLGRTGWKLSHSSGGVAHFPTGAPKIQTHTPQSILTK